MEKHQTSVLVQYTQAYTKSPSSITPVLASHCSQQVMVTDAASLKGRVCQQ